MEGHGCLGFHMGGINISGRIKQSFYPRTRHGELKVISMIYAPPYLMRRRKPKVKSTDHELATSPTITPSTQDGNTGKQATVHHYYYGATHQQGKHHTTRQRDTDLPSRTVTSRLSGHRSHTMNTARLRWFKLFSYRCSINGY